ncbi:Signal transduction histidine kinase [Nannocystis exedens]|uniref:Oxygen sensor histidine kinase NreB n=1 Tax=Nannocystis exedens TaxID=54 RepID=A0A1I1WS65_9BACT|nr:sensor histidine kinase [Nannocystis exedens]PCC71035.1 two-component sensor histidine kinase [Nannocystis exedens]SFD98035.1 Signal transduction histidine kinase [Nannocystis exedens]
MSEKTVPEGHALSGKVGLRRYLSARMLPLVVLLLVLVSASAPLAYAALQARGLREQARATAVQAADAVAREVQERPVLWRYDAGKLLAHLRAYVDNAGAARIEIADRSGVRIPLDTGSITSPAASGPLAWEAAPIVLNEEVVGHAWVAVSLAEARAAALLLLGPFGLLGVGLAGLLYFIPLGAITRAERRIEQSQAALARFNQTLEQQVAERSSQLGEAYEQLRQKEGRLRELSARAVLLQEAERRVIARELHDSAGQALTAIRINLQLMVQLAEPDSKVAKMAARTLTIVDATLEEIRRAVSMLGPAILDDVGLVAAIERLCDDFEREDLEISRELEVPDGGLSAALESVCYRVTQEALTNAARHAGANELRVVLRVEPAHIVLEVRDNGRGFVPGERGEGSGGRGLVGMRERVELLGGNLRIDTAPGAGTAIHVELPRRALSDDGDDSAVVVA